MFKSYSLFAGVLFTCFVAAPVCAATGEDNIHITSAFLLADKKRWDDALGAASKSHDSVLKTLIQWQYILAVDSQADFSVIKEFIQLHPDWPEQNRLRIRAEMALPEARLAPEEIVSWLGTYPPLTGVGKITLVTAMKLVSKQAEAVTQAMIREAWVDGDFTQDQEKSLLENYGQYLRKEDDVARTDRLVWEKKYSAAERMYPRVGQAHKALYQARIALQADKKNAPKLVSDLPAVVKKDVGLLFDRLVYRARKDDDNGVRELLLAAPKKVPYPERWWKYREQYIREAMGEKNNKLAEQLLVNHGQEEGQESSQSYSYALWLKGWMLLEYKKQPKEALNIFSNMFAVMKYPVSKARAAYWAGKAADKAGDNAAARHWFESAGNYPTTFYGQLASLLIHGDKPLQIPVTQYVSEAAREEFNRRGIVQAIKLCIDFGEVELAEKLIKHLVSETEDENTAVLASELGTKMGKTYLSVRGAKKALRNHRVMVDIGYPVPKLPENLAVPRELALSITRQESEFNDSAKSSSGALGLMQLLPATAKETAKKNDISFHVNKLYDADYNMVLGSLYLRQMIDSYDGSVVMAVAAYNAGPGNVRKWVQKFGRPENTINGMVEWIENIPFAETRNYVQRVLENLQVYRHIQARKSENTEMAKLLMEQDLLR